MRPAALLRVVVASGLLAFGCGGSASEPRAPGAPRSEGEARARFEAVEDEILRELASLDARVALRAHIVLREDDLRRVAMSAVLAEDTGAVLLPSGAVDPFSFGARERGVSALGAKLAKLPEGASSARGERELLARLVAEEALRLTEEKQLPRSASALVRALVSTWREPTSAAEAEKRDRDVSRRLREVRESLGRAPLDRARARDLDDALDALEHLVDTPIFRSATAEVAHLRAALEAGEATRPSGISSWEQFRPLLRAHLGVDVSAEDLDRTLTAAEARARALSERAGAEAALSRDETSGRLESLLFVERACLDAVPGSRVRSMAASPEREPACHLRHATAEAPEAARAARALALMALHDHVVVARWALEVARGSASLEHAVSTHHLLAPPSAGLRAKLERVAVARPVAAVGAGLAAALLLEGADPATRAKAWSALGDVPFDVAARDLHSPSP